MFSPHKDQWLADTHVISGTARDEFRWGGGGSRVAVDEAAMGEGVASP